MSITRRGPRGVPIVGLRFADPVSMSNPTNVFRAKVKVMFGDADGYETVAFDFTENERDTLVEFLNFLSYEVAAAYPGGRGGDDLYETVVPNWNKWFGYDSDPRLTGMFSESWPSNWEMGGEGTFESVEIVHFDGHGVEYNVDVVFEN